MNLFYFLLRTSRRIVFLAVVAGLVAGASGAGLIALIHTVSSNDGPLSVIWVWRFAGVLVVATISAFLSQYLLIRLFQKAIADLRMDLSRKIVAAPMRHIEELGDFRLLAALTDDVRTITTTLRRAPLLVIAIASLAGGVCYLVWLSWTVLLVIFGFIVLGISCYGIIWRRALSALRGAREEADKLFKHFRALTDGNKELKLHRKRREVFLFGHLQSTIESFQHENIIAMTFLAIAGNFIRFLLFALLGGVIFVLPTLLEGITPRTVTGYVIIALYMMRPLMEIVQFIPFLGQAKIALEKIESLGLSLDSFSTEVYSTTVVSGLDSNTIPLWERLELVSVTHTYHREKEDSSFSLGPIDLFFCPGELVFLVGGNGSGKTTLAKIIIGLYPPQTGEIRLDGKPITDKNRDDYRQLFSVVFSDFYLFEDLLGLENPDLDAEAQDYLIQLQLNHKVKIKDGMLSTTDLSGGQRKRLALLTAFLEDRPFYVFDEWASDQDPLFKKIFYTQILPELKARGKTVLVISHDDRYFYVADRCIKMEDGVLQHGTVTSI